ncbi:helix-turn-helix domain-containing protein [Terrimicrobium sacchariphilum]|uniref:helix-turn-helix domain-containing protein n=1 Tax=Terrimicrobium sacchariphilum TaxID=690879 RepID=UPI001EDB13B5|nr:AraC family transcriptional regulator [Terrimicrobium sacchariphilum]
MSEKFHDLNMARIQENPIGPLEDWENLRTELVWAYQGEVTQYANCRYPAFPFAAWLLLKGSVTLSFSHHMEKYKAGRWIFPRAEEGWQEFSHDAEVLSIRFIAQWPTGDPLFDRSNTISVDAGRIPRFTQSSKRLVRVVRRQFPGITDLLRYAPGTPERHFEFHLEFSRWLLAYTRAMREIGLPPHVVGQLDDRVRAALDFMESNNLRRPPNERQLAQHVGVSVTHLNRLFSQDLGKTPIRYWEDKRIQAARYSIEESSKSLKSIAYDMGFASLSHFSSWVRRKLGKSPRALRALR